MPRKRTSAAAEVQALENKAKENKALENKAKEKAKTICDIAVSNQVEEMCSGGLSLVNKHKQSELNCAGCGAEKAGMKSSV